MQIVIVQIQGDLTASVPTCVIEDVQTGGGDAVCVGLLAARDLGEGGNKWKKTLDGIKNNVKNF